MLTAEWNIEEEIAYVRQEALEEGREEGLEKGLKKGLQEGWGKGRKEGCIEIAQSALAKGYPLDMIHDITGLDLDVIQDLQEGSK